jgi:Rha family phage regulatory protein
MTTKTKTTKKTQTTKAIKPRVVKLPKIKLHIEGDEVITTSNEVADIFGKQHKNVVRKIEQLIDETDKSFTGLNFEPSKYKDKSGKYSKSYHLTKDGFMLAVMSFTGVKAQKLKIAYINEFNRMADELQNKQSLLLTDGYYYESLLKNNLNGTISISSRDLAKIFNIDHKALFDALLEVYSISGTNKYENFTREYLVHLTSDDYGECFEIKNEMLLFAIPTTEKNFYNKIQLMDAYLGLKNNVKTKELEFRDNVVGKVEESKRLLADLEQAIKNVKDHFNYDNENESFEDRQLKLIKKDLVGKQVDTQLLDIYIEYVAISGRNNSTNVDYLRDKLSHLITKIQLAAKDINKALDQKEEFWPHNLRKLVKEFE